MRRRAFMVFGSIRPLVRVLLVAVLAPAAAAQDRGALERLGVEDDWSVLVRPEGGCLAVPTGRAAAPLSLVFAPGPAAMIQTPYDAGIGGFLVLKVDRSDPLYMVASAIPDPRRIEIPADLIPEMWAGRRLILEVDPLDRDPETHEFSLAGLSAAVSWFDRPRCRAGTRGGEQ